MHSTFASSLSSAGGHGSRYHIPAIPIVKLGDQQPQYDSRQPTINASKRSKPGPADGEAAVHEHQLQLMDNSNTGAVGADGAATAGVAAKEEKMEEDDEKDENNSMSTTPPPAPPHHEDGVRLFVCLLSSH